MRHTLVARSQRGGAAAATHPLAPGAALSPLGKRCASTAHKARGDAGGALTSPKTDGPPLGRVGHPEQDSPTSGHADGTRGVGAKRRVFRTIRGVVRGVAGGGGHLAALLLLRLITSRGHVARVHCACQGPRRRHPGDGAQPATCAQQAGNARLRWPSQAGLALERYGPVCGCSCHSRQATGTEAPPTESNPAGRPAH